MRLADGDRASFDVLLDALWPVILSFAQRSVGPDADDVAQEVFYRICSRISDFDRSRDGVAWAFGIAGYEVMTHRRRVQRRGEIFDAARLDAVPDGDATQEEQLLQREHLAALEHALGALSPEDRRALGVAGISASADIAGATLRKRRQRALARLRRVWRDIHGEP